MPKIYLKSHQVFQITLEEDEFDYNIMANFVTKHCELL
jgi:hypothetical protein